MPKIFLYLSSLIGILFIFIGVFYSFISKNNHQPQIQINTVQEINNQEEKKEEIQKEENTQEEVEKKEEKEIEEEKQESIFLKILYFIMMVIFTLIAFVFIIFSIFVICENCIKNKDKNKTEFKEAVFTLIFQILLLLGSFLIKGKIVSVIAFIIQIIFVVYICLH